MSEKKGTGTSRDELQRVFDIIEGPDEDELAKPIEEVREELQRDGIDTTSLKKFARERLIEIRAADKLARARAERERFDRLRESVQAVKRERGPHLRDQVRGIIQGLANSKQAMAEVYFRKFENASDDDLLSLLDDLEMLDATDNEHKE